MGHGSVTTRKQLKFHNFCCLMLLHKMSENEAINLELK